MKKSNPSIFKNKFCKLFFVFMFLLFSACTPRQTEQPTAAVGLETPSEQMPVSATNTPEPTPTMISTGKVVLIEMEPLSGISMDELRTSLQNLASSSGLIFESRPSLQPSEIAADWKIVFMPGLADNLSDALVAAPQVQFVVVSEHELGMANNLNVIRWNLEDQAFMSGYISTLIASDWRAAALLPSEEPAASTIEQAYLNGGHYYCGICNSYYSPIKRFPLSVRIPAGSDASYWQSVYTEMQNNVIYVFYVAPDVSDPDLLRFLAQQGMVLVGGQTPPDDIRTQWAVTISQDLQTPVAAIWNDLVNGIGGKEIKAEVVLSDLNENYLTTGKQRVIEEIRQALLEGMIYPLDVPLQ